MTASRALNGERYVSQSASIRVLDAAKELGFVAHHGARSLATNRTGSIALITPMEGERFFNDPNIAPIFAGAAAELTERNSQLVVLIAGDEHQRERARDFVLARHVDGAIIVSPEIISTLVDDLLDAGVPLAATGSANTRPGLDIVDVDTALAVEGAAHHLLSRGARRLALIAGSVGEARTIVQESAFRRVVTEHAHIAYGHYAQTSARAAMAGLLHDHPNVDGVLVMSDVMAVGAVQAIQASGRRIPSDIRIVGYDDSIAATTTEPPLSTVRVPFASIGEALARLVLERVEAPDLEPRRETMATELIVRGSS